VAIVTLTEEEVALRDLIGTSALLQAREHLRRGDLIDVRWDPQFSQAHGRLRGAGDTTVAARVTADVDGAITALTGCCNCERQESCAHAAALVLAAMPTSLVPRPRDEAQPPAWENALSPLVTDSDPPRSTPEQAEIGLQFELTQHPSPEPAASWRIGLRPVVPGKNGWVRGGISWSTLNYSYNYYGTQNPGRQQRRQLLGEILALAKTGEDQYYSYRSYQQQVVYLDEFATRRIWDLLAEAAEVGLPLVQSTKLAGPVLVLSDPARTLIQAERCDDDLLLTTTLLADGVPVDPEYAVLVGKPAHGVAWWGVRGQPAPAPKNRVLRLAPLASPVTPDVAKMLVSPAIRVPASDEERFFERYYPSLLRRVEVVALGPEVRLPEPGTAVLTLTLDRLAGHQLAVTWEWVLPVGERRVREPLWGPAHLAGASERDSLVRTVTNLVADAGPVLLEPTPSGERLAARTTLTGDSMIRFLNLVLPGLTELEGVEVVAGLEGSGLDYQEARQAPVISFAGFDPEAGEAEAGGSQDWFDLEVRVTVEGERVAFNELFIALAQDQQYLILPSGTYFSLDREEFRQLRELIAESRALEDAPPGALRVNRFQAGLWQDLAELGELTGQAAAWQASVRTLTEAGDMVQHPVPSQVKATLRPYQLDGFRWLAALHGHRLGGVLADDMGLGKTLQALALICHLRHQGESTAPFLVVAPASVVYNWASEADRFTPDLRVRAITQTKARRGLELAAAVSGADVVVTSYTLFRLEYDAYATLDWGGLILDEAQFVKNPQSQAYRCAKRLPAPFKLAITGTPMENNLIELWSLLSITAPGLFARADRFTEYYRTPIERGKDTERLAQLRRRIRPLMLRRRKSDVVVDLPDKQEQVVELELNPKHRRVYQTYLQRERQKVLGLLGDLQKNRFEIFRSLTLLRQAALDVNLVDPKHHAVTSTKLDALVEQVVDLVAAGHRSLVFSQFTRFLDAARKRLEAVGVRCCYLDGSTRHRANVIDEFKKGTAPVFLISLKAGGFGLNLTEADYCVLLDPWWNPATEAQAVDRVHRIGQTRNVMVYRLVAKDTIEEKVMALKARKAELFSSVLDGGDFASAQLTASDIQTLLE
jgi:superfamily II DNA or RNA helicase